MKFNSLITLLVMYTMLSFNTKAMVSEQMPSSSSEAIENWIPIIDEADKHILFSRQKIESALTESTANDSLYFGLSRSFFNDGKFAFEIVSRFGKQPRLLNALKNYAEEKLYFLYNRYLWNKRDVFGDDLCNDLLIQSAAKDPLLFERKVFKQAPHRLLISDIIFTAQHCDEVNKIFTSLIYAVSLFDHRYRPLREKIKKAPANVRNKLMRATPAIELFIKILGF